MAELTEQEKHLLRRAIDVSRRSRENGNHPFGAIFVDSSGKVLAEAENSVVTTGDLIGHAETNLARDIGLTLTSDQIAGAMYWAGVNRLVYGMNESDLLPFDNGERDENATMTGVGCRAVLASGQRRIEVSGPHLVEEAVQVHHGFWGD